MAVVIICILAKLPAIPSMLAGSLAGALIAIFVQGKGAGEVLSCACSGFVSSSGNEMIDRLLSAGGLQAMMESVSIIILAMSFGGIMRKTGQMEALVRPVTSRLRRDGSLSAAVVLTCFLMNFVLPDQYLSISMPGQIYADSFDRRGISRERLGAVILGGGAVTSPLVPWNTCGIYCMTMLSVPTFAYAPFVFFGLLLPVVTILFSCFTHRREFSRSACQ
jgi:NhaC family Na+:H+ antiporter